MSELNQSENDFDTIHGTSLADPSKPLIIYWDKKKALDYNRKERPSFLTANILLLFASLFPALMGWILLNTLPEFLILPLAVMSFIVSAVLLPVSFFCIYKSLFLFRKDLKLSLKPLMEIKENGIGIHCPSRNFDFIPWNAIKEVRAESIWKQRFLRIVPKDPEYVLSLESSTPTRTRFWLEANSELAMAIKMQKKKGLIRLFIPKELKVVSINIPEAWMPFSADEVAEFINIRLFAYGNNS